jgi:hypothetical protein
MVFKIEVLIKTVDSTGAVVEIWRPLRPSNGGPYVFETEKEAEAVFNMCYPRGSKARVNNAARVVQYRNN